VERHLFGTHVLALPFDDGRVHGWVRPLLQDLLLVLPRVDELGVRTEIVPFGCLPQLGGELLEGLEGGIEGRMRPRGGFDRLSFHQFVVLLLVLLHPVLVIVSVCAVLGGNGVGRVIAGPGDDVAQGQSVLVEKNSLSNVEGAFAALLCQFLLLLQLLLEIVAANSRTLPILLVDFDEIEIGILRKLTVHLQIGSALLYLLEIPRFLFAVLMRGGYTLRNL
jgi:hypothetical protein